MDENDPTMQGFLFLKAVIHRYGTHDAADLMVLSERLVKRGLFKTRREALNAIERQAGLEPTVAMSRETADYVTRLKYG